MSDNRFDIVKQEQPALEKILALNARPGTDVATIAAQEIMYFEAITETKPDFLKCTPQSIVLAIRDVMKKNLTLDPNAGLVYIKTRSVNIGTRDKPNWISVLEIQPTANGYISINRQLGRILDYTYPEVTKDGTGKVIEVSMKILLPSVVNPRWEKRTFDESDFMRWRIASHKENGRGKQDANTSTLNYANANYTSWKGGMDPEFARAKCIKHSLKKLGTNQQESGQIKVYDVPAERVIDPAKDEAEFEYLEPDDNPPVDDKIKDTIDLPNSDEL